MRHFIDHLCCAECSIQRDGTHVRLNRFSFHNGIRALFCLTTPTSLYRGIDSRLSNYFQKYCLIWWRKQNCLVGYWTFLVGLDLWQVRTFKVTVTADLYSHGIAYTYLPATELLSQTGKTYPLSSHGKFVLSGGPNMVSKKRKEKKEFGFTSTSAAKKALPPPERLRVLPWGI